MHQFQDQDNLSEADRGLLLERLVALERLQEAEVVLHPWLSGRTTPRKLTLFKADPQRRNGQPETARRSLQNLLRLHPNDSQVRFCNFLCLWTKSRDAIGRPQRSSPPGSKTWSLASVGGRLASG